MRAFLAVLALAVATAYYFVWPGRKNPEQVKQRSLWSRIVLRWFHSLTWVLLAVACFLWAKLLAALAGVVYLIFILTLAHERSSASNRT